MVVHWGQIGAILGGLAGVATIVPFLVKILVKPVISDEIAKLEKAIEKRWQDHLRTDHGYGYGRGQRQSKQGMYYKEENDHG